MENENLRIKIGKNVRGEGNVGEMTLRALLKVVPGRSMGEAMNPK